MDISFEQIQGDSEGQGSLVCGSPGGHKESDTTERLNNNKFLGFLQIYHPQIQTIYSFLFELYAFISCLYAMYLYLLEGTKQEQHNFLDCHLLSNPIWGIWGKNKPRERLLHHSSDPRVSSWLAAFLPLFGLLITVLHIMLRVLVVLSRKSRWKVSLLHLPRCRSPLVIIFMFN